nr:copia protein [Tanacetum cinerariifolium]
MADIFSSSSYDDDFCADVTNFALNVVVDLVATKRVNTIHPQSQIIGELQSPVQTRKPSGVAKALADPDWVAACKRRCNNSTISRGIVVKNKARLVAQGNRQEEGIDYDEVFALVSRIEAIRLFLAFSSYIGFMVYQMDVKIAFLYGEIEEEVYVYVDDIIFGSTNKAWCDEFEVLMKGKFEMSDMGELTFFLGLQVKQLPDGIFISRNKYVKDMLKKFDMESVRTATIPYEVPKHKSKDEPNDAVNVYLYRSMIGSLMYLTASRPNIMFACKKQTVLATSSTEAEYVAAASCCGQISLFGSPHWDAQSLGTGIDGRNKPKGRLTIVYYVYPNFCAGMPLILLVVPVFLLVVLVPADGWVPTGSCIIPTGSGTIPTGSSTIPTGSCTLPTSSYSFMLLGWFISVVMSHIRYALTHRPRIVFDSLVKQFWATATVHNHEVGPSKIIDIIDGNEVVVTKSLIRTQLQLNDVNGLYEFTLHDVLDGMREIGYPTDGSLTFYKAKLSPQWRFLIHTIIHCMSPKSGGWNQFPSSIASTLI